MLTTSLVLKSVSAGGARARVDDGEERWDDDGYKIQVITGNSAAPQARQVYKVSQSSSRLGT